MSESKFKKGQFFWSDLTVPDATSLKEFYKEVIGWQEQEVPMNDNEETYADYAMTTDDGAAVGCVQRQNHPFGCGRHRRRVPGIW